MGGGTVEISLEYTAFGAENVISHVSDFARSVAVADFNGDGHLDVVFASQQYGKIAWYANTDGLGTYGTENIIANGLQNLLQIVAGDIDGDNDIDILATQGSGNPMTWYENIDGLGTFAAPQIIAPTFTSALPVELVDLDGDSDLDILGNSSAGNSIVWVENFDGMGNFGTSISIDDSTAGGSWVVATDIDGDLDIDVVAAINGGDEIVWYENLNGQGAFGARQSISTAVDAVVDLAAADLDGDGDNDLLSASYFDEKFAWYENLDGNGTFGSQQLLGEANFDSARVVAPVDIDLDGDLDVIVGASSSSDQLGWFKNLDGNGNFSAYIPNATSAVNIWDVVPADIDEDGKPDVVIASASSLNDTVAWLPNAGDFTPHFFTATTDNPLVTATVVGSLSQINYAPEFTGTARVTVTKHDGTVESPTGRTDKTSFDLHVGEEVIYGILFRDVDGNGQRDDGEPILDGWPVESMLSESIPVGSVDYRADSFSPGSEVQFPGGLAVFSAIDTDTGQRTPVYAAENPNDLSIVFDSNTDGIWYPQTKFRVDFAAPVESAQIEFHNATPFDIQTLIWHIYDVDGNELDALQGNTPPGSGATILSFDVMPGEPKIGSMEMENLFSSPFPVLVLDRVTAVYSQDPVEPTLTLTDANGEFRVRNLLVGTNYAIVPQLPADWVVTTGSTTMVVDGVEQIEIGINGPVLINGDLVVDEGSLASLTAIYNGTSPTYDWSITRDGLPYAGGGQVENGADFTFTPDRHGVYTVSVDVNDGGMNYVETVTVIARNLPPVVNLGPDVSALEGQPISLSALISDPGPGDTISAYAWSVTNTAGVEVAASTSPMFDFAIGDDGTYTVRLAVADSGGRVASDDLTLNIQNDPVSLTIDPASGGGGGSLAAIQLPGSGPEIRDVRLGEEFVLTGTFGDTGNDIWTGTVDFGDGTIRPLVIDGTTGTFSARHTYQRGGTYLVKVTIDDQDGGSQSSSVGVVVGVPRVTGVFVRSSGWTSTFLTELASQAVVDPELGLSILAGPSQRSPLVWANIDRVSLQFSQDVGSLAGSFLVHSQFGDLLVSGVVYDSASRTATWMLTEPLAGGLTALELLDRVVDVATGLCLDGEWTNNRSVFPSGNGNSRGTFLFSLYATPGDYNGDRQLNSQDVDAFPPRLLPQSTIRFST